MRGDILMARKMFREAVETYSSGDPDLGCIANKIGIAYHQMMELELARRNYERAIKLDPSYSEAINNLGTVYYARKNYRKAVCYYNKALKLKPNSASIYSNLGTAQFARKKYKQAMEAYDTALPLDPEVFEHRGTQGVLLQERSIDRAREIPLLPCEDLCEGRRCGARADVHSQGAGRGIQGAREVQRRNPSSRSFRNCPSFSN